MQEGLSPPAKYVEAGISDPKRSAVVEGESIGSASFEQTEGGIDTWVAKQHLAGAAAAMDTETTAQEPGTVCGPFSGKDGLGTIGKM